MELLAPAGNWEAFLAAMGNGADAVYLGGQSFSARHYAENFNKERIDDALSYAHLRKKKVYVTVNTLIADHEFAMALDYIWDLYQMGVDAVIVQDIGLTHALRKLIPDLRLHASTQMTVHNSAGAVLLREEGVKRVVLAREMSRDELAKICCEVKDMEFEVFVHGALCYSYSGQCLFSSLVGGRSGNRGRCAQPCRLAYQLFSCTGDTPVASEGRHILSPADLCLIEQLGDLQRIGIHSLKIEGRMKRAEYVAVVTRAYREVLDSLAVDPGSTVSPELKKRLERIFNRNFTGGCFQMDRVGYLSPKRPNNRGIYAGRVVEQSRDITTRIKLTEELRVGDGLEIWVKKGQGPAFTVKDILLQGKRVSQAEPGDIVSLKIEGRAGAGDRVFKTYDSELMEDAQASIEAASRSKLPLDILVSLQEGEPLSLLISDGEGRQVKVKSPGRLQKAEKHPLTREVLQEKMERLGNTPFYLSHLSLMGEENLMIPFSELNETRRRGCDAILQLLRGGPLLSEDDKLAYRHLKDKYLYIPSRPSRQGNSHTQAQGKNPSLLSVTVSGIAEAYSALEAGADKVYLQIRALGKGHVPKKGDLKRLLQAAATANREVVPALSRIQHSSDKPCPDFLAEEGAGAVMVGNLGDLRAFLDRDISIYTDYSLNVFNSYSLRFLLDLGVKGVCLSPELSWKQLQSFGNIDKVEMLVHGELLLMISRHCMLGSVMGRKDAVCSGYCRQDSFFLRDEKGFEFPVLSDRDCRFYLFNSRTLCMIEDLEKFLLLGPGSLRIEAYRYNEKQVSSIVRIYRKALQELSFGQRPELAEYKKQLIESSFSPFTRGHYYRGVL